MGLWDKGEIVESAELAVPPAPRSSFDISKYIPDACQYIVLIGMQERAPEGNYWFTL